VTHRYATEIAANLERAETSLQAAKEMSANGYYDFAASRAYYAAFYAATAILLSKELTFRKHSGVIAFIHREFIRAGKLDQKHGKNLNWLFELRNIGDYGVTLHVSQTDAEKAIEAAEDFVTAAKTLSS
jgi:uncharacterized protein (UPF0332 family)